MACGRPDGDPAAILASARAIDAYASALGWTFDVVDAGGEPFARLARWSGDAADRTRDELTAYRAQLSDYGGELHEYAAQLMDYAERLAKAQKCTIWDILTWVFTVVFVIVEIVLGFFSGGVLATALSAMFGELVAAIVDATSIVGEVVLDAIAPVIDGSATLGRVVSAAVRVGEDAASVGRDALAVVDRIPVEELSEGFARDVSEDAVLKRITAAGGGGSVASQYSWLDALGFAADFVPVEKLLGAGRKMFKPFSPEDLPDSPETRILVTPPPPPVTPPPVLVTPPPAAVTPPPAAVTPPPVLVTPPPRAVTPPPIEVPSADPNYPMLPSPGGTNARSSLGTISSLSFAAPDDPLRVWVPVAGGDPAAQGISVQRNGMNFGTQFSFPRMAAQGLPPAGIPAYEDFDDARRHAELLAASGREVTVLQVNYQAPTGAGYISLGENLPEAQIARGQHILTEDIPPSSIVGTHRPESPPYQGNSTITILPPDPPLAIRGLSPQQTAVLRLVREGLSNEEIAEFLRIPRATVWSARTRGIARLRTTGLNTTRFYGSAPPHHLAVGTAPSAAAITALPYQREIVTAIGQGVETPAIATRLALDPREVAMLEQRAYRSLGFASSSLETVLLRRPGQDDLLASARAGVRELLAHRTDVADDELGSVLAMVDRPQSEWLTLPSPSPVVETPRTAQVEQVERVVPVSRAATIRGQLAALSDDGLLTLMERLPHEFPEFLPANHWLPVHRTGQASGEGHSDLRDVFAEMSDAEIERFASSLDPRVLAEVIAIPPMPVERRYPISRVSRVRHGATVTLSVGGRPVTVTIPTPAGRSSIRVSPGLPDFGEISPRQQDILRLTSEGLNDEEIARVLDLSLGHIRNMRWLAFSRNGMNRSALGEYAARFYRPDPTLAQREPTRSDVALLPYYQRHVIELVSRQFFVGAPIRQLDDLFPSIARELGIREREAVILEQRAYQHLGMRTGLLESRQRIRALLE